MATTTSKKVKNPEGTTGKALQMNENSLESTELYEDKNAEILEEDQADERKSKNHSSEKK